MMYILQNKLFSKIHFHTVSKHTIAFKYYFSNGITMDKQQSRVYLHFFREVSLNKYLLV